MTDALWISEHEVVGLLDLRQAIETLRVELVAESSGHGTTMVKTHVAWDAPGTLHAVGGTLPRAGLAGTKTWAHTPRGACPLLVLFDANDGSIRAIIEAFALGQLRTSAVSGLATDLLAAPDAEIMAIAGTGKQALAQVAAVLAVRQLQRVLVWGPTRSHADSFASRVRQELGVKADAVDQPAKAIGPAAVVTLATRATEPFVDAHMPTRGAHLNAIGAITPERAEFHPELLDRAGVVAADSVSQARSLSHEFRHYYGDDNYAWSAVKSLSELIAEGGGRPKGTDLTVFKAMGIGLADVALGARVLARAQQVGAGRPVPQPIRSKPRLHLIPDPLKGAQA